MLQFTFSRVMGASLRTHGFGRSRQWLNTNPNAANCASMRNGGWRDVLSRLRIRTIAHCVTGKRSRSILRSCAASPGLTTYEL